ncbi:MAG TPA: hypothetical protein VM223_25230 [Planctomycetota bacterium]|nr:hypothetical protein [Planctomycetota bacterium]HUW34927.1 hypothetical protein [Planctomycetota bacterium]
MAASQAAAEKISRIYERLGKAYGKRRRIHCGTLLEQLILTILSSDASEAQAFRALMHLQKEYVDWNEVRVSDDLSLSSELHRVGVNSSAPVMLKNALENLLLETSTLQPEVLDSMPFAEMGELLGKIKLPKWVVASVLLMEARARHPMGAVQVPVDEGVARMMWRMGFASTPRATVQIQECIRASMPDEEEHNFHRVAARFSREYCGDPIPRCAKCPIRRDCSFAGSKEQSGKATSPAKTIRQTGAARRSRPPSLTARAAKSARKPKH